MNTVKVENCKTLFIGRRGENEVTEVVFDFTEWQEQFGTGVIDLYVKRNLDIDAYPVVLSVDGTVATWLVSAADTDVVGNGKIEYVYTVNEKIAKSAIFQFFVGDDIGESSPEPPEHYQSWLEQLTELGAETQANAQAAAQSASEAAESASEAAESAAQVAEDSNNAEAWAVGERNGEPVSEGDPTYDNNAKYWAENARANAPVQSVNGEDGYVVLTLDDIPNGETYVRTTPEQLAQIATNSDDIADVKATADTALQPDDLRPYRTAAAQDAIDQSQNTMIGIAIQGKQAKITASGILKGDGAGGVSSAVAGVDYLESAPVTSVNGQTGDVTIQAATDAQVTTAVNTWLGENVSQETGYVLDASLTMSNAAPPASAVGELKSAVNRIDGEIYYSTSTLNPNATSSGWRLNESDGLCSRNAEYKMDKYLVTAGETLRVVSDDRFQFQTTASVPSSGASNRVGNTYGAGEYIVTVPDSAIYLIVSTLLTSGAAVYGTETIKNKVDNAINETNDTIKQAFVVQEKSGNPIRLVDSVNSNLIALSASDDCTVFISGKNLISANFDKVQWDNRADETIIYGKGAYEYVYPARINVEKCENDTIKFTTTASQFQTTGVGVFIKVRPSTNYSLSYNMIGNGTASIMFYNGEKAYTNTLKEAAQSGYSFLTRDTTQYLCVSFRGLTQNESITFSHIQLEEGTSATEFTQYQNKQSIVVTGGTQADVSNVMSYSPVTIISSATTASEITVSYYAFAQGYIDEQDKAIISSIQKNAFVSSYNILDGWEPHAKAFSEMMLDVEKTEGFMFFTDTHFMAKQTESEWKEYAYTIFAYLEQLYYASPCSFVLHGGDWLGSNEAKTSAIYKLSTLNGIFRSKFNKFALLVGNHETGNQMQGNTPMTHGTLAATLLANVGNTYYKFHANTFEMYCFDSWVSGTLDSYANEQIAWFANSLMGETAEHIVMAIHILYDNGNLKPFGDELTKCALAYNDRTTYTYNGNTYNFGSVSGSGKVAFVIAGHEHGDNKGSVNGIPYIMTINTTGYSETTFANLPLPVDLIKVDWNTKKLTAYRAARGTTGTTRELTILA